MAQRRQNHQRQRQQFQRSPGNFGPPAKRPRTGGPLPPLEWDFQDRGQGGYAPQSFNQFNAPTFRQPRSNFMQGGFADDNYGGGFGGDFRDRRGGHRMPQQQFGGNRQQQFQQGGRPQHMQPRNQGQSPRGPPQHQHQHQHRGTPNKRGGGGGIGGGGIGGGIGGGRNNRSPGGPQGQGQDNWGNNRRQRRDRNRKNSGGKGDQDDYRSDNRHWAKTYWINQTDPNQFKRQDKKPDAKIPEEARFKILCAMVKTKFHLENSPETLEMFLREKTVGLKPSFVFKRADGQTKCKFFLNDVFIAEGSALTRSEAKAMACDKAAERIESEDADSILTSQERVEVAKLTDEDRDYVDHNMTSHLPSYSGERPISDFVILQGENRSSTDERWSWASVLIQSAALSRMEAHFQLAGQEYKRVTCNLQLGGRFMYNGRGRMVKDARNWAAKGTIQKLQKTNYTLLLKERPLKKEGESLEKIPLHEHIGTVGESSVETLRSKLAEFMQKHVKEEDRTAPLVISTEAFDDEEKEIIMDVAKDFGFMLRDTDARKFRAEKARKEHEKREKEKKEREKAEKEKKEQEAKEKEKAEKEKKEQEAKEKAETEDKKEGDESEASVKKEDSDEKMETEEKTEENKEKTEEPKAEKKEETKEEKGKEEPQETKEEKVKEEADEKHEEKEETAEESKEVKDGDEKEVDEDKKDEDENRMILVYRTVGIDTLEYVLNRGGETWNYKVLAPGEVLKKPEDEKQEEEVANKEGKEENGEGGEEAQEGGEGEEEGAEGEEEGGEGEEEGGEGEEEAGEGEEEAGEGEEEGGEGDEEGDMEEEQGEDDQEGEDEAMEDGDAPAEGEENVE